MSGSRPQPAARELVFCHQCEDEWYRDEHGIVCPQCQSDFTEILEGHNDPQSFVADRMQGEHDHFAPDPDEEDIDRFQWHGQGSNNPPFGERSHPGSPGETAAGGQELPGFGGIFRILGQAVRAATESNPQSRFAPAPNQQDEQRSPSSVHQPHTYPEDPTSPNGWTTQQHRHVGPNFSFTITSSTRSNMTSNLTPRNANEPQPFQEQPGHIADILGQIMMNINNGQRGVTFVRGGGGEGGPNVLFAGPGGGGGPPNFMNLFGGGRFGDAVFSQEGLDRVITQLMEQNQTGNAPGPASQEAINSLQRRAIDKNDLDESSKKAECSICMDETPVGTIVTALPCKHWFHHDCIEAWLSEHDTCPHCRQGITARDDADSNQARRSDQAPLHDTQSPRHQNTSVPGSFPFPFARAESHSERSTWGPSEQPSSPTPQARPASGRATSASDLFSRMRSAFGGGGGGGSSSAGGGSSANQGH